MLKRKATEYPQFWGMAGIWPPWPSLWLALVLSCPRVRWGAWTLSL